MRPVARSIGLGVTLLALAACNSLGPDYARPALIENDIGAPDIAFSTPAPPSPRALAAGPWWSGFGDPVLNDLVPRALKDNPDILQAQSLVRQAKADAVQVRSDGLPSLDGSTSVTGDSRRAWTDGPGRGSGTGPDGNGQPEVATDAGLEARYEVDLFGAQDRREQASAARIREAEADLTQTQSDVSAEVVTTYLTLRGTQTRLALARDSLALQRQTRDLVQGRVTAGLAPELDLTRARAAVQGLEADLILLESAIRRIEVEISVLLGQPPGQVAGLLASGPGVLPRMDFAPEVGVPADLLRNRADLQAAEAALIAATAEIGVAEAALYPSLTLPGSLRFGVSGLGGETIVATVLGSLGAVLDIPLLDFGARRAGITIAQEEALQAALSYRAALLSALEEVETALIDLDAARQRRAALARAVATAQQADAQARALYAQGLASFQDVLDTQRDLTATLQDEAVAALEEAQALADLSAGLGVNL